MHLVDRAISVALGLAIVGMLLWARRHANVTGELLTKGTPIYRDNNPKMFRFFYTSYGVLALLAVVAVVGLAVGLGSF